MAAMITTRTQLQGRDAIRFFHPEKTEDEDMVILSLLNDSALQADEDSKNGIDYTTEDVVKMSNVHMGWDEKFFETHPFARRHRKMMERSIEKMNDLRGRYDGRKMEQ